jgi:hypothetical protein
MSPNWRQAYTSIADYVTRNPRISLGQEVIEIPDQNKTEFYNRFNLVRASFIEEHFPAMIPEAAKISRALSDAEIELLSRLGLEEIELPPTLRWYVKDPIDALRRMLYDSLFDLLRGKIDIEYFETTGMQFVRAMDNRLRYSAYQFWLAFSLAVLLEPQALYTVDAHVADSTISHAEALNPNEQPVKRPVQATRLSLRQEDYIFTVPDMILKSIKLKRCVAIRIEPRSATWTATNASEKAEWLPIDVNAPFLPGMIIVNLAEEPWDLALVADADKIRRPDAVIISEGLDGWYECDWMPEIMLSNEILKPKAGTFVVSRQTLPAATADKTGLSYQKLLSDLSSAESKPKTSDIHVISAALDRKNLERIVSSLSK